jgi:pimeloyl-ACP methyl ester carboxylesterase
MLAPRGDGHPVLVLPAFLTGDASTIVLRSYLAALGYAPHAWEQGLNFGAESAMRERLLRRLTGIEGASGRRVSIVGWSAGGLYARDLALALPELVRSVITLGCPVRDSAGDLAAGSSTSVARAARGERAVPTTAIYSKTDGIVNWRRCVLDESSRTENLPVYGSHLGLAMNPSVLWAIGDRLAQADGTFCRFRPRGPFALAYPN